MTTVLQRNLTKTILWSTSQGCSLCQSQKEACETLAPWSKPTFPHIGSTCVFLPKVDMIIGGCPGTYIYFWSLRLVLPEIHIASKHSHINFSLLSILNFHPFPWLLWTITLQLGRISRGPQRLLLQLPPTPRALNLCHHLGQHVAARGSGESHRCHWCHFDVTWHYGFLFFQALRTFSVLRYFGRESEGQNMSRYIKKGVCHPCIRFIRS